MKTFIVGTGRCGTVAVTELLNRSPHINAGHEVPPILIREATQYANGELPHNVVVDLLRRSYNDLDVIVNHKFSTVIPAIVEAYPGAKFIWMTRRAAPFVSSFVARGLYADPGEDVWKSNLPDFRTDQTVPERFWELMTQIDKCAWYWSFINMTIEIDFYFHKVNFIRMPIEDLSGRAKELFDFLDIPLPEDTEPNMLNRTVPGKEVNLTKEDHRIIDMWTAGLMARYYGD